MKRYKFYIVLLAALLPLISNAALAKDPMPPTRDTVRLRAALRQSHRETFVKRDYESVSKLILEFTDELATAEADQAYVVMKELLLLTSWIGDIQTAEQIHQLLGSTYENYDQIQEVHDWIKSFRLVKKTPVASAAFARYAEGYAQVAWLMGRSMEARTMAGIGMAEAKLAKDDKLLAQIQRTRMGFSSTLSGEALTLADARMKVDIAMPDIGFDAKQKTPVKSRPSKNTQTSANKKPDAKKLFSKGFGPDGKLAGWQSMQIGRWNNKPKNAQISIEADWPITKRINEIVRQAINFRVKEGRTAYNYPKHLGHLVSHYYIPPEIIFRPNQSKVPDNFKDWRPIIQIHWINAKSQFCFVTAFKQKAGSRQVICFEKKPDESGLIHVGFASGSVKQMSPEELDKLLKKQTGATFEKWSKLTKPGAGMVK